MDARLIGILKTAQAVTENPNPLAPENSRWMAAEGAAAAGEQTPAEDPEAERRREMELARAEAEADELDGRAKQMGAEAKKIGAMTKLEQARLKYEEAKRNYEELKTRGADAGALMEGAGESLDAGAPLAQSLADASPANDGMV